MTDAIKHIDLDDEEFYDAPRALREYASKLKARNSELEKNYSTLQGQLATRALGDVLAEHKFKNPKRVEKDLLADGIDPLDEGAVSKWLADFSDDYARASKEQAQASGSEQQQTNPDPALVQGVEQIGAVTDGAQPAAELSKWEAAQREVTSDMTPSQVREVYLKHGL